MSDGGAAEDASELADARPDLATFDAASCGDREACLFGTICCAAGEECVDGRSCLPACETRCGDNGEVCCEAGEICLEGSVCARACPLGESVCGAGLDVCCGATEACLNNTCAPLGAACTDDFDCLEDGTYCERSFGEGAARCLPIPTTSPVCEVRPDFDSLSVDDEWHWPGVTVDGRLYENVAATPAVGDVNGDGVPDVVVPVYAGENLWSDTLLVALDGRTGDLLWRVGPTLGPCSTMVALADFDPSDDALEIAYSVCTGTGGIRVIDGSGTPSSPPTQLGYRASGAVSGVRISPTVADLNADGRPDIIAGCVAFDGAAISGSLTTLFSYGSCVTPTQSFASTVVANLDADPEPEVTSGGVALNRDGSTLWEVNLTPHGLVAVADLNLDEAPEVVVVRAGRVVVRNGETGAPLIGLGGAWFDQLIDIPGGGEGGAPTIADFDGDGLPEIATAGRGQYVVYDPDCLPTPPRVGGSCETGRTDFVLWTRETQDLSSSVTGSSVFDFQGDGAAEVVYNDECFFRVYDGRTSEVLLERPNSSRTVLEYPVVVDVDRDGNSEIVLPANRDQVTRDGCAFGTAGIYVLGDPSDRWVKTRPIWNQFSYHVTNIGDLGETPAVEADNWTTAGLNNYRQNVQGAAVFNAPNLQVSLDAVARCGLREVRLIATIRNVGSRGAPAGIPITFVRTDVSPEVEIGVANTTAPLLPGGTTRVSVVVSDAPYDVMLRYEARVGDLSSGAEVNECNADDNVASAEERCLGLL